MTGQMCINPRDLMWTLPKRAAWRGAEPAGLRGCAVYHQGRDWDGMGQLAEGGALPKSRESHQGESLQKKILWEDHLQTFDRRSQSHPEPGPANKNSPALLSLPLFPSSDSKGVRSPKQQAGEEKQGTKRNFTSEIRLGLSGTGQVELNWDWVCKLKSP